MAYTSGTSTNFGSEFHFPSGTVIYACQVIGFPELSMGERNITNHASAAEERVPNGLSAAGDYTVLVLNTPGVYTQLDDLRKAKTINTTYLKDPVGGHLFDGWIKSVMQEGADAKSPDNLALSVVVTPVGAVTLVGGH